MFLVATKYKYKYKFDPSAYQRKKADTVWLDFWPILGGYQKRVILSWWMPPKRGAVDFA